MKKGFTLIELLVVVLIIGILAAVALPKYEQAVAKTRYMSLLPLLRAISDAENIYYMANGTYTLDFTQLDITMPAGAKTTTASRIDYDNFYCFLRFGQVDNWDQYSVYCNSTYANMPWLEKYFDRDYFACWAAFDNEQANRICQSVSGKKTKDGTNNARNLYRFQ